MKIDAKLTAADRSKDDDTWWDACKDLPAASKVKKANVPDFGASSWTLDSSLVFWGFKVFGGLSY